MMTCMVSESSVRGVKEYLEKAGRRGTTELQKAIKTTALLVQGTAKKNLQQGAKSGVTYYRIPGDKYMTVRAGGPDGPPVAFIPGGGNQNLSPTHTASAPGEAPASDTGQLASSVTVEISDDGLNAKIFSDNNRVKYGAWLEFGTRLIEPRPWLIPALYANKENFEKLLQEAVNKIAHPKEGGE